MPASQAPDNLYRINSNYRAIPETTGQNVDSLLILAAAKNRNNYSRIAYIEICIGNGQA